MAKGAPEAPQGGGENSLDFLWLVVLVLAAVVAIWYFGKIYIAETAFWLRLYEIIAIKFVVGYFNQASLFFNFPTANLQVLDDWQRYINAHYGATVEFKTLATLSSAVGQYVRYPVMLILLALSARLYFSSAAQRFRTIFDMKRLRNIECKDWPYITPVVGLDLVNQQIDKAPWSMALNPMQFCKKNNLIQETIKNDKPAIMLKRGAANRILSLQLGARWYGPEALPEHLQALVAIFTARIDADKKSADHLLEQIAISAVPGNTTLSFNGAKELMQSHINVKSVQKAMRLHGYVTGVLASLLMLAREAGVLATAEFIWLKTVDRRMWYMLNSVGRPTAMAEIAGAFAHWLAERKLGLPLMVPMVDEAVRGLEAALNEILYKPEED